MRCADCRTSIDTWATTCPGCGAASGPTRRAPGPAHTAAGQGRSAAPWLVLALVLVIAVGGGAWALRPPDDPEGVVTAYFAALADRDAGEARSYLARSPRQKVEVVLLGTDAIEHPDYTPPRDLRIERLPSDGTSAVWILASYRVAGAAYEEKLRLVNENGHGSWRILGGWAELPVNTRTALPLVVAGTAIPSSTNTTVAAFPGGYVVRLADHPLFEPAEVTAVAGAANAPALPLRLRGNHHADVERQVREHLDGCAGRDEPDPPGCPFTRAPEVWYPPAVSRRITHYPTVRLSVDAGGTIGVIGEAEGRTEVTTRDTTSPQLVARESFAVVGSLSISDDQRVMFAPV